MLKLNNAIMGLFVILSLLCLLTACSSTSAPTPTNETKPTSPVIPSITPTSPTTPAVVPVTLTPTAVIPNSRANDSIIAPNATPTGKTPDQAAVEIRQKMTDWKVVLLPTDLSTNYQVVQLFITKDFFDVQYENSKAGKQIRLNTTVPNPPSGSQNIRQYYLVFQATDAYYQDYDTTNPTSRRHLIWNDACKLRACVGRNPNSATYYLRTVGLTEAEFWQLAHTLS